MARAAGPARHRGGRLTMIDAWQGRRLGSALVARLSRARSGGRDRVLAAEVRAENRTMLVLLPGLGPRGDRTGRPVIAARMEPGEPSRQAHPDLHCLLTAAARHDRTTWKPLAVVDDAQLVDRLVYQGLLHGQRPLPLAVHQRRGPARIACACPPPPAGKPHGPAPTAATTSADAWSFSTLACRERLGRPTARRCAAAVSSQPNENIR